MPVERSGRKVTAWALLQIIDLGIVVAALYIGGTQALLDVESALHTQSRLALN